jgi:hypothetical protein
MMGMGMNEGKREKKTNNVLRSNPHSTFPTILLRYIHRLRAPRDLSTLSDSEALVHSKLRARHKGQDEPRGGYISIISFSGEGDGGKRRTNNPPKSLPFAHKACSPASLQCAGPNPLPSCARRVSSTNGSVRGGGVAEREDCARTGR